METLNDNDSNDSFFSDSLCYLTSGGQCNIAWRGTTRIDLVIKRGRNPSAVKSCSFPSRLSLWYNYPNQWRPEEALQEYQRSHFTSFILRIKEILWLPASSFGINNNADHCTIYLQNINWARPSWDWHCTERFNPPPIICFGITSFFLLYHSVVILLSCFLLVWCNSCRLNISVKFLPLRMKQRIWP